jgi:hypothetical protein
VHFDDPSISTVLEGTFSQLMTRIGRNPFV